MEFKALTLSDCQQVREWRNSCLNALRTPYPLTEEMQEEFYKNVICNRNANARFWGIHDNGLIGMAGIENIEWENRRGEISIILKPDARGKGNGKQALEMLLHKGFFELNLEDIWGVVYSCSPAVMFWLEMIKRYEGYSMFFVNMKYWQGNYYSGRYFNFEREVFKNVTNNTRCGVREYM